MTHLSSHLVYYSLSISILYIINKNLYLSTLCILINDFLSLSLFSRFGRYLAMFKSIFIYLIFIQKYIYDNLYLYQKNKSYLYILINILYLLNFITFLDRIHKMGFFNRINFLTFIKLIISSNLLISLLLQYLYITNLHQDIITITPFVVSYMFIKVNDYTKILWNISYIFTTFLLVS
jgi:hypothetical protein